MPDQKTLEKHYENLSDLELLKLRADGGFTSEAEHLLDKELARRKLTPDDAKRHFAPDWLEKAVPNTLGILSLQGGERITVEMGWLNEDGDKLSVEVINTDNPSNSARRSHRTIPLHRIVSFEPQPHLMEQWPFSDPCRNRKLTAPRFYLFTTIILIGFVGSMPIFLTLIWQPYGLQEASVITYTCLVLFLTFATHGGGLARTTIPGFKFSCPAVKPQLLRLTWLHLGFLAVLFVLQTEMLAARPRLPDWWDTPDRKGSTPFDLVMFFLCFGILWTQIFTNRWLLKRAQRQFSEQQAV